MTVTMETKRIQIPKQELTAELKVLAVKRVKAVQSAAPPAWTAKQQGGARDLPQHRVAAAAAVKSGTSLGTTSPHE